MALPHIVVRTILVRIGSWTRTPSDVIEFVESFTGLLHFLFDQAHTIVVNINGCSTPLLFIMLHSIKQASNGWDNDTIKLVYYIIGSGGKLPFQTFFIHWHLNSHVRKFDIWMPLRLWGLSYRLV